MAPRIPGSGPIEGMLDTTLDRALAVQRSVVTAYLDRVRRNNPEASPAEVIRMLERRYLSATASVGAAAGGAAALPGVGTAASLAASGAEVVAFVEATALFTLALAEVHGVYLSDPDARRALVIAVLLGESGVAVLESAAGRNGHWQEVLTRRGSREGISGIKRRLARHMLTRFGSRQGALLLGRALPLGIGAGIGAAGNAALARLSIRASRRIFGAPPSTFGPRIVDV
jgi:hypothetical protein